MTTTDTALVIPADPTVACRLIDVDPEKLLDTLYAEIGTDCVDSGRFPAPFEPGYGRIWVSDDGLMVERPEYNDRAIALARHMGWEVPALAGTAVVTGGEDPEGESIGLDPIWAAVMLSVLTPDTADDER